MVVFWALDGREVSADAGRGFNLTFGCGRPERDCGLRYPAPKVMSSGITIFAVG